MHFNHKGVQVFFLTNEKHSSFLLQDSFWNDQEDSHSWVFNAGLDRFVINGDLLPAELKENKNQVLNQVSFNSITLRAGGSGNWVWDHWFAGGALGFGSTFSDTKTEYEKYDVDSSTLNKQNSKLYLNYFLAISAGYRWRDSKIGVFARALNWNVSFDNLNLSSTTTTNGFYYSMIF